MENCVLCKNKLNQDILFVSYVRKDRAYEGYTRYNEYERFLCSQSCLETYEKTCKCNFCNIVIYNDALIKEGEDGYVYCNDKTWCNIGNETCYNQRNNYNYNYNN
jgi:hypothetical protein